MPTRTFNAPVGADAHVGPSKGQKVVFERRDAVGGVPYGWPDGPQAGPHYGSSFNPRR